MFEPRRIEREIPQTPPPPYYNDLTPPNNENESPWRFSLKNEESVLDTSLTPLTKYEGLNQSEVEPLLFASSESHENRLVTTLTETLPNTAPNVYSLPNAATSSQTNSSISLPNQSQENINIPLQTVQTFAEVYT